MRYRKGGRDGAPVEVRARREVILSGGTVNSPQLLQISGVGPPALLQSLGIGVRHALPGVGENLRDHYAPRFVGAREECRDDQRALARPQSRGRDRQMMSGRARAFSRSRPTLVYVFWKSATHLETSDIQLTFTPASYQRRHAGPARDRAGHDIASWQQRPESIGYVRIRSADPFEQPVIQPNYLTEEIDRRVLLAAHAARAPPS